MKSIRRAQAAQISLNDLMGMSDLVPQAIIRKPVSHFVKKFGYAPSEGKDDLDHFEGVALTLNGVRFAIIHYAGFPKNVSSIYLEHELREIGDIKKILAMIATDLRLKEDTFEWRRQDDPDF